MLAFFAFLLFDNVDLSADPRLAKTIDVRAEAEMIGELLPRIAEPLKLKLEAAPSVSQDLIILLAKQKPAHEVLTKISEHFGWEWEKTKEGYRLLQSEKSQKAEREKREEIVLAPYLSSQKAVQKLTRPFAEGEIEKQRSELDRLQKEERGLNRDFDGTKAPTDEHLRQILKLEKSAHNIRMRLDPAYRLCATAYAEMSNARLLYLDDFRKIVFGYNPTALQTPMPVKLKRATETFVREIIDKSVDSAEWAAMSPDAQKAMPEDRIRIANRFRPEDVVNVLITIKVETSDPRYVSEVSPDATIEVVGPGNGLLYHNGCTLVTYAGPWREPLKIETKHPALDSPLPNTDRIRALRGNADSWAESYRWLKPGPFAKGSTLDFLSANAASQCTLAEELDKNFISDAHDCFGFDDKVGDAKTPREAITELTSKTERTIVCQKGWIESLSSKYAYLRATNMPRWVLRKTRDALTLAGGVDLGILSSVVAEMTNLQLSSEARYYLFEAFGWSPYGLGRRQYAILRAYHFLTAAQKLALQTGLPLQRSLMSPFAREQFDRFCWTSSWSKFFERDDRFLGNTEADHFRRTTWTGIPDHSVTRDGWITKTAEISQWYPNGFPGTATFSLSHWTAPAITIQNRFGEVTTISASRYVGMLFSDRMDQNTNPEKQVRLADSFLYGFGAELDDNLVNGVMITLTRDRKDTQFGRHANLPDAVRKLVDDEVKEQLRRNSGG